MDIAGFKDAIDLAEHTESEHADGESNKKSEDVKPPSLHDMRQIGLHGTSSQLKELYETVSDSYDEHCEKYGKEIGAKNLAKSVESTQPNKEGRILDVGCGNGLLGKQLSDIGFFNIDGLDFAQGMLDLCKSRNQYKNYIKASIEPDKKTPGIADNTYDVVCLNGVFAAGHVTSNALPELARMVKPGGSIVFNVNAFTENTSPDDFGVDAFMAKLESLVETGLLGSWKTTRDVVFGTTGEEGQTYILHLA